MTLTTTTITESMLTVLLSALSMVAAQASGNDPFVWKEAVPQGTTVEVHGIIGSIRAVASGGREFEVIGTRHRGRRGDPGAVEIRVIRENARIFVCAIYPRDDRWNRRGEDGGRDSCERAQNEGPLVREGNDTRIDFEVRVPAGVHLVAETVTEGVVLSGLRGNAEGYSISGDVRISDVRGTVVDAASISGDITFDRVDAAQVYAGTLSGDVVFGGVVQRRGDYSFLSYTGDLRVALPSASGVTLEVIAPRSGLQSSVTLTPASTASRRRYSGRQGNGSARMSLTTLNGEVVIRGAE
jgi:hypothetical protein